MTEAPDLVSNAGPAPPSGEAGSLPGPAGHMIVGSRPESRRDMLGFLMRCAREYGDISGFRFYNASCCLLNHPSLIEQVLVDDADRVIKSWDLRQLKIAFGNGLLTNEGGSWRHQRRLIQPAFHKDQIRRYGDIMVARCERMLDSWQDGAVRDLHADMMRLTLEIVAEAFFSVDLSEQAETVERALGRVMDGFEVMLIRWIPLPLSAPTPGNLRTRRAVQYLEGVVFDIIRRRRIQIDLGDDLLACLLDAEDENGMPLDDRQIRDEVLTLLMAGHETTALALSWSFFLLARHPEAEARLVDELDRVLAGAAAVPEKVTDLTYTRQVIQESMRLYPPAWGIGRQATRELTIAGHRIEPRTQIFMAPYVTHRDPRFFPDPERFRPERWAEPSAERLPKFAYFPFAGGPRHCIGSGFAMMEAILLLAGTLQRFHLELLPDHPIELQPAVTLRPRYGIRAKVHRR